MSPCIIDPEVSASAQVTQVLEAMRQLFAHGGHKRVFQRRGVVVLDRPLRDRDDRPDIQACWLQAGEGGSFPRAMDTHHGPKK